MTKLLFAGVCLAAVFSQLSLAQTGPVPYTGIVKADGQAIPGATVKATQGDRILLTVTDENGAFRVDGTTAGLWNVEVSMFGFDPVRKEVSVSATGTKSDFTLSLRERARAFDRNQAQVESTDVSATASPEPPPVSSESSNESFLVNGSLSAGLQTTGQDMRDFGGLGRGGFEPGGFGEPGTPGADAAGPAGRGAGPGGRGGGPGGRGGGPGGGGFAGGGPGGGGPGGGGFGGRGGGGGPGGPGGGRGDRAGGGRGANGAFIGNRSRRGADQIRMQAFYTFRNSALDAKPFALNGVDAPKAAYAQNRFGFNIGGPLIIPHLIDDSNKGNFFINYTGNLLRNGYDQLATLPTPAMRGGDFSSIGSVIYNPTNGQPFAGNKIPTEQLNPIAVGLLKFIPLPNQLGVTNGIQNFRFITAVPSNSQSLNTRFNQTLTKKDRLAVTFNFQNRDGQNAQVFGFRDEASGRGMNSSVTWSHTLGARSFQNLVVSFNRNRSDTIPFFAFGDNVAAQLGILGASPDPRNFGPPNLSFTNYGALSDASPVTSATQSEGIADNVSFHRGKHNFNVGGDYRWYLTNTITDSNGRGTFTFTGLDTSAFDASGRPLANTGWDFADFLLGSPQSKSIRFGASSQYFRSTSYSAFISDDYRVSANLSLTLGLRYEYFTPSHEKYGRLANLDIAPGFTAVSNVVAGGVGPYSGSFSDTLINPDRNNFSPRFGFAWKPTVKGKTVLRGGYGWYYNLGVYNQFARQLAAQPPFASSSSVQTSTAAPLTLATGLLVTPAGKTITNTFAVDRFYRDAYAQTWNLSVQTEVRGGLVIEAGYTGTKGTRLDIQRSPNRAAPGSPLTAEQRLAIGNATGFTFDSADGNSILHSGTLRIMRRLRAGLSAQMLYTFSKSIDDSSNFGGAGNTVAQNDQDIRAERGLSSFDHRHAVTGSFSYASPVGGKTGLLNNHKFLEKSLKDWNLSSNLTAQTGSPFTARVLGNVSDTNGTGNIGSGRANATGLPIDAGTAFFNATAFTIPTIGFGNAGRNTIPGPGLWSIGLGLTRSIALAERKRLEFSVNAANFLNHVNISSFGTVVNSLTYGFPTAAGSMRSLTATVRFRM